MALGLTAAVMALVFCLAVIIALGMGVKILKQAIADLTTAVNANTAAINAAIAAGIGGGTSAADIASVQAITAVVQQNNAALTAATPAPPAPVPVP